MSFTMYLQNLYAFPLQILYFTLAYTFGKLPTVPYGCLRLPNMAYLPLDLRTYGGYDDLYTITTSYSQVYRRGEPTGL